MKYIPRRLYIGFKHSSIEGEPDLAYVGYYGETNKLHKKDSIDNWRNKEIPVQELDNDPMEGFIFGRKVGDGGYGYNKRKAWVRVLDPRGFEIEITVDNVLLILKESGCLPGGKLIGKYVYFFDDGEMNLLPITSSIYKEMSEHTEKLENVNVKAKDVTVHKVYTTKSGEETMYLGRFPTYIYGYVYNGTFYKTLDDLFYENYTLDNETVYGRPGYYSNTVDPAKYNRIKRNVCKFVGQHYWFVRKETYRYNFYHSKTFPKYLLEESSGSKTEYDIDYIERKMLFNPNLHQIVKTEWRDYPYEEFEETLKGNRCTYFFSKCFSFRTDKDAGLTVSLPIIDNGIFVRYDSKEELYEADGMSLFKRHFTTAKEVYDFIQPQYFVEILDNGNISCRSYYKAADRGRCSEYFYWL